MTYVPFETAISNHPLVGEVNTYATVGGKCKYLTPEDCNGHENYFIK
jgi:hypothetical protein